MRRDSGIGALADLRGRDIAFADPISESGYLYPLAEFVEAGLIEALGDANVAFVEDGGPLHGGAVRLLADRAVTDFRVNRI